MDFTAWVALSLTERIGGKTLRALQEHFDGDLNAVLRASEADLRRVAGIGPKIAQSILAINREQVASWVEKWQAAGIQLLTLHDARYPNPLRELDDAPPTLFVRGCIDLNEPVAIVGTRSPSAHALDLAFQAGATLASDGCTVVSGLAYGVDAAAHRGALSVPNGQTIAVLGCGVDRIYPHDHRALAEQCTAVVSEVAPFTGPSASRLVARNRIISGLSSTVIIIETDEDGGAMHAARRAREQDRRVCAIDLPASGNQRLIREGAAAIETSLANLL